MQQSQRELAQALLRERGITRLVELRRAGVTAATVGRMKQAGEVRQLARGLYQLPDAELELHHGMAEAAKRVPKGVICLVSALVFHELTLELPGKVWMAIGKKAWAPTGGGAKIQAVRFADRLLNEGFETHIVEGVSVKVFSPASAVVDCFRHPRKVERSVAIEGLREGLRQRKTTPEEIGRQARNRGAYRLIKPYLETLITND